MHNSYRVRQSDNKHQWFVEIQEGNAWKITSVRYTEAKANEVMKITSAIDRVSSRNVE